MEENEKLLEERRTLLLKISEAEEMGSNGMRAASTVQHRCRFDFFFFTFSTAYLTILPMDTSTR